MRSHGSEQNTYLFAPERQVRAEFFSGVPPHNTSWRRSQKPIGVAPWTYHSRPGPALRQRSLMRSQTGSSMGQVLGYFAASQRRSAGPGNTQSNQTLARYVYALA